MTADFGIITNCTARKRAIGQVARLSPADLNGDPGKIAARWLHTTSRTRATLVAGELYVGRAMTVSRTVASRLGGSLHVISAGLGLASGDDHVPNYDLTVSNGAGSLAPVLAKGGYQASDWWHSLNELKGTPLPLSQMINGAPGKRFLLALPSTYVGMLEADLENLHDESLDRLSIFTSRSGAMALPPRLQRCALPYDERLEGHHKHAGTRADFPQRAMRHFVDELGAHRLDSRKAARAVACALDQLEQPVIPERMRKTDQEIVALIRDRWDACQGQSSTLLYYLRRTALVACEQSRFSALWRQVKAEAS